MAKAAVRSKAVLLLLIHCFMDPHCFFFLFFFFVFFLGGGGGLCWSLFCYVLLCVLYSFAMILTRKRELVDSLYKCNWCRGLVSSV